MDYTALTLAEIGRSEARGRISAAEEIETAIRAAAATVLDENRETSDAIVTVRFRVTRMGEDAVGVALDDLVERHPKPRRVVTVVHRAADGDLLVSAHRQRELPLGGDEDRVRSIRAERRAP